MDEVTAGSANLNVTPFTLRRLRSHAGLRSLRRAKGTPCARWCTGVDEAAAGNACLYVRSYGGRGRPQYSKLKELRVTHAHAGARVWMRQHHAAPTYMCEVTGS